MYKIKRERLFAIKTDYREDSSGVADILNKNYNVEICRMALEVGDYVIEDVIVIERKTTVDFAQSIIDGRLFRQAARMRNGYDICLIIIEGRNIYNTGIDIHPNAIRGALISLVTHWQIPVIFSKNSAETALFLWTTGEQLIKARNELSARVGRRPKQLRKRQLFVLQGLPDVGPKLATKLLAHFGSVAEVFTASEAELMKVSGLGKTKAAKIKEIIIRGG